MTLFFALLGDAFFGEPRVIWDRIRHPAVIMGRIVGAADARYNSSWITPNARRIRGALLVVALVCSAIILGVVLSMFGWVVGVVVLAILVAQRSLIDHVRAVAAGLRMSVGEGRRAVAMIVGRDTRDMDAAAISRGAIESAAENFSDGVVAPVFWFLIAGLPGLLVYKIVNTADSMIGYRTVRHEEFGWAAARFDDLLNLIPARISAVLIAGFGGVLSYRDIAADARLHRSPNAGWPEAAMARALDVALSGPRAYNGEMRDFPLVHSAGKTPGPADIERACMVLWRSWCALLVVAAMVWFF